MTGIPTETLGWTGDIIFILAYYLVSSGKLKADSKPFNFMNLIGAILFGSYAMLKQAFPILILELFWGGIATLALYKVYFSKP